MKLPCITYDIALPASYSYGPKHENQGPYHCEHEIRAKCQYNKHENEDEATRNCNNSGEHTSVNLKQMEK